MAEKLLRIIAGQHHATKKENHMSESLISTSSTSVQQPNVVPRSVPPPVLSVDSSSEDGEIHERVNLMRHQHWNNSSIVSRHIYRLGPSTAKDCFCGQLWWIRCRNTALSLNKFKCY